ncbi:hypothetical protein LTR10_018207 [Elasticomyces elasticus]|uniref:Uncharacterized protein n=1 Tax=Exophiala sideris TaxID=1016849 RepID=A0ABR0J2X1_9EURO|nr:hypothetical protein LTR10_018207 [Elasticomyces elasticus]KAK5024911.1 hypothetical protein LTS07_008289 [Exophiala sideris]KAK5031499.1 hypothetical protein LTR13_007827 [Exophiala sideris]KAK5054950.1 hypothetical protein LTR69_008518 [Exophiala sideris]KAK5179830.1 hypothetical protein LTR44_007646 [Eurotiomycetes sp. CCFEE 6388]
MPGFSALALAAFSFLIVATHAAPAGGNDFRDTRNSAAVASSTFLANTTTTTAGTTTKVGGTAAASSIALDPNAVDCELQIPANALTAEGLSTPWVLLPPCSQAVSTQQAFAEAAVLDPEGQLSVYHPLVIDQGKTAQAAPGVPNIAAGNQVILYFGFNGNTLTLVDTNGQDSNASPTLQSLKCVNGLPGAQGDVFGQVGWCNTVSFWEATDAAVASGKLQVPPLGTDNNGNQCISSHSFAIVDQDQSDNLPTKYLLLADGSTVQFTAANQARFPSATEIDNASDEALIADFVDPVIGCSPFSIPSIDDPGTMVASMASQELQAVLLQNEPAALVPLNDPDTLLTSNGQMSSAKTNAYRLGVNMPPLGNEAKTDDGSPTAYCNNLIAIQPPFLAGFQTQLSNAQTPDATVGNNLFTFLANRFLQSLTNLNCPNKNIPVTCTLDGNGAATACSITATLSTGNGTAIGDAAGDGSVGSTATDLAPTSAFTITTIPTHHLHSHGFGGQTIAANPHTFKGTAATTAVPTVTPTGVNAGNGTALSSQLLTETGVASASQISGINATVSTGSTSARNGGARKFAST